MAFLLSSPTSHQPSPGAPNGSRCPAWSAASSWVIFRTSFGRPSDSREQTRSARKVHVCAKECKRLFDYDPTNHVNERTAEYATQP